MNQEQAWAEGRRRWGERADASEHRDQFSVGWRFSEIGSTVVGRGSSWQEAFQKAEEFHRCKNTPAFVERVLTLRAILNDDFFGDDDERNLREIIQSQKELPKLAEKLVAQFRPKLTFVKDHNALPKEKLDAMEAFFDKAEKDLAEFTSKFPPVLPFCSFCSVTLPKADKGEMAFCTCSSKKRQMDIYIKYAEQRTEFFTAFVKSFGWKGQP